MLYSFHENIVIGAIESTVEVLTMERTISVTQPSRVVMPEALRSIATTGPMQPATRMFVIVAGIFIRTHAKRVLPSICETSHPANNPDKIDPQQPNDATADAIIAALPCSGLNEVVVTTAQTVGKA
mmetsp:Transcript_22525/g.33693  ORF Transcript_22525/g.33693 Transcript_22525/m.33693 type:complete len:126 (+) Transcript_22525:460-837(+)